MPRGIPGGDAFWAATGSPCGSSVCRPPSFRVMSWMRRGPRKSSSTRSLLSFVDQPLGRSACDSQASTCGVTGSMPGAPSPTCSRHAATADSASSNTPAVARLRHSLASKPRQIDRRIDAAGVSEFGDHAEPGAGDVLQHVYVTGRLGVRHQRQPFRPLRQRCTRQGLCGFCGRLRGVPAKAGPSRSRLAVEQRPWPLPGAVVPGDVGQHRLPLSTDRAPRDRTAGPGLGTPESAPISPAAACSNARGPSARSASGRGQARRRDGPHRFGRTCRTRRRSAAIGS